MWIIPAILGSLLLGGVWIGAALALTGLAILYFLGGGTQALLTIPVATWNTLFNFSLAALPLYVFLGEVFVFSGLANKSYNALAALFERFPGKLLLTNSVVCAMFGAVLGSSMACAATVGAIAYPELRKRGYQRTALVGNLAGSGTLGSFIPPSLGLIIYGAWVEVSVGACFMAAVFPALITLALFMTFIIVLNSRRTDITPQTTDIVPLKQAISQTKGIWPMLVLIASIVVVIYFGIATPTEAGGIASLITIIMAITFKSFSLKSLRHALIATARICGMLTFIIVGATIFSISVSVVGIPRGVVAAIGASGLSAISVIILVYLLYLILGCFVDFISMLLMTLPFVFPIVINLGYDPFWFGVVLTIVGEIGLLTPPVGMNLYVLQGVTQGEVSLGEVAKGSIPYFLMLGITLLLITAFPQLCTWLPSVMQ